MTGRVHGVYWLTALDNEGPIAAMDAAGWHDAARTRAKNLADTLRQLYDHADHDPFLVAGIRLGGRHGYDPDGALYPLDGAVNDFTRPTSREKINVLVKAVDFAAGGKAATLADRLIEETLTDPGCVEVGGDDTLRWAIGLQAQPSDDGNPGEQLSGDSMYVVTGAAERFCDRHPGDAVAFTLVDPDLDRRRHDLRPAQGTFRAGGAGPYRSGRRAGRPGSPR